MFPPLAAEQTLRIFLIVLTVGLVSLRFLLPAWWQNLAVRWGAALAACGIGVGYAMWVGGPRVGSYATSYWGVVVVWGLLTLVTPAVLTLPVVAVAWKAAGRDALLPRRKVLQAGAAMVPATALGASADGLASAQAPARVVEVPIRFPKLPPDLEGLRILQLSDLHLGACLQLADFERFLARAAAAKPDLVLFTGDLADDVRHIGPALRLAYGLRPRLGVFASLGNHEYIHDVGVTRPLYEKTPVPLLVDEGLALRVGKSTLWLGGSDEPAGHPTAFDAGASSFDRGVRASLARAPSDAFRLLMCHRPEGFVAAAREGYDLTLSGHTHGGQVGLFGRSALPASERHAYWWGTYARGDKRLYTTSGFGHWFPFRLGCPAEAPLIVLARG
jgi:uncharacterized protein